MHSAYRPSRQFWSVVIDLAQINASSCGRIRQQVQRIRGQLLVAPVKTRASQRGLPLLGVVPQALKVQPNARRPTALRWVAPGMILA
jgi:hypothetical protein